MPTIIAPTTRESGSTAEAAPARDLLLDAARALALFVVVAWHWVFTTVFWDDGPHAGNPLPYVPGLWLLTWVLQPMPLFFIVGGVLHSRAKLHRGWVAKRVANLVKPAAALLVGAALAYLLARLAGRNDLANCVLLAVSPMWFLAVYVVLVTLVPLARRAHAAFGVGALGAGLLAVGALDLARFGFGDGTTSLPVTLLTFIVVWSVVAQLGFFFDTVCAWSLRARIALAASGWALMGLLVSCFGYPAAMVGTQESAVSNMAPPSAMVVALGLSQLGVLALVAAPARRALASRRERLTWLAGWSMPVFVWHLVGFMIFWVVAVQVSGSTSVDNYGPGWWTTRALWVVGPALVTGPLLALATRRRRHVSVAAPA